MPDGTTTSPSVLNPPTATGRYLADYLPGVPGRHTARWVSTGPASAFADTFDVRPATPAYLISLQDAKAHLNLTRAVHDEELRPFLEAATDVVEEAVGEVLVRRSIVETRHVDVPRTRLFLHHRPVVSLTAVATVDGATVWNLPDLYTSAGGLVTVRTGRPLSGHLSLAYTAGYTVVPPRFTLAARMIVESLWESQRTSKGAPRLGGQSEQDLVLLAGRLVPREAAELLGQRLSGIA